MDRTLILEPVIGVTVRLKMNKQYYHHLIRTMNEEGFKGQFVAEKEVNGWIYNVLYGQITREKLERQRQQELNNSDMM